MADKAGQGSFASIIEIKNRTAKKQQSGQSRVKSRIGDPTIPVAVTSASCEKSKLEQQVKQAKERRASGGEKKVPEQESPDSASAGVDNEILKLEIPNIDDSNKHEESTATTVTVGADTEDDDDCVIIDVVGGIVGPIPNTMLKAIDTDTEVVNLAEDLDVSSEESSSDDGDNQHQADQAATAIEDNKLNLLAGTGTLSDVNGIFTEQLQEGITASVAAEPKSPTITTTVGNGLESMEVKNLDGGSGAGNAAVKDIELNLTTTSLDVNLSESVMEFDESSMSMNDSGAGITETGTGESSNGRLDTETESDSSAVKMASDDSDPVLIPDRISGFDTSEQVKGLRFILKFKNSDQTAFLDAQVAHRYYPELVDKFYDNLSSKEMPF